MRVRMALVLVVALALGFAPAPWPRRQREQSDLAKLQGEWVATKSVYWTAETKEPTGRFSNEWATVRGNRLTFYQNDRLTNEGEMSLSRGEDGLYIDYVVRWEYQGRPHTKHYKGVYRIEGSKVTVCWSRGGARPRDFAGGKYELYLIVLERRKH